MGQEMLVIGSCVLWDLASNCFQNLTPISFCPLPKAKLEGVQVCRRVGMRRGTDSTSLTISCADAGAGRWRRWRKRVRSTLIRAVGTQHTWGKSEGGLGCRPSSYWAIFAFIVNTTVSSPQLLRFHFLLFFSLYFLLSLADGHI